ncbi:hypothetical protein [Bosea vaviloviae]|uniref:Uncharacterized protein n=1 Tax=Bosea vaviloviae TaxID=1526658 RepID=A0A0N1F622_9HYPH|nr:hypothetical protein [Bosea vaviloviae]KPH80563.1 hypothetical protein AE618_12400 [Bosea vaviloviae]
MRDLISNLGAKIAIPAASYDADNTPPAIDLRGFDSAAFLIHVGVGGITFTGTNKVEFKLTHADSEAGAYTAVTAADVQGVASVGAGGIVKTLNAAHASPSLTKVGYVGGKPFAKLLADFSGTHGAATPIGVTVALAHPRNAPVA